MIRRLRLSWRFAALLLAAAMADLSTPAHACRWNEEYEPDKPFDEVYLSGAKVIFRGRAISYRYPEPGSITIIGNRTEVTFDVVATYQGEQREEWTALWITTAFPKPDNLAAFRREIGEDLVVVLDDPEAYSTEFTQFPFIAHQPCSQPAMRSFAVMEPVLRSRGLID